MPDFIVGLDLGQASDSTALAVLRRSMLLTADGLPDRDHRRDVLYSRSDCTQAARDHVRTIAPPMLM
jgi:hypothetical protein